MTAHGAGPTMVGMGRAMVLCLGLVAASACVGSHREENSGENGVDECAESIANIGGGDNCGMPVEDALTACRRQRAGMDDGYVCCAPWNPGCTTDTTFCDEVLDFCSGQ